MINKLKITKGLIIFSFLIICCNIYPINRLSSDPILKEKVTNFHKERNAEALEKIGKSKLFWEKSEEYNNIIDQKKALRDEFFKHQKISKAEYNKLMTDLSSKAKDLRKDLIPLMYEINVGIADCAFTIVQHCLSENTEPFTKTDCSKIIAAAILTASEIHMDLHANSFMLQGKE